MLLEIRVHKSGLKDYCSNFFESSKRRVNNSNDHEVLWEYFFWQRL